MIFDQKIMGCHPHSGAKTQIHEGRWCHPLVLSVAEPQGGKLMPEPDMPCHDDEA